MFSSEFFDLVDWRRRSKQRGRRACRTGGGSRRGWNSRVGGSSIRRRGPFISGTSKGNSRNYGDFSEEFREIDVGTVGPGEGSPSSLSFVDGNPRLERRRQRENQSRRGTNETVPHPHVCSSLTASGSRTIPPFRVTNRETLFSSSVVKSILHPRRHALPRVQDSLTRHVELAAQRSSMFDRAVKEKKKKKTMANGGSPEQTLSGGMAEEEQKR